MCHDAALLLSRALAEREATMLANLSRCRKRASEPAIHDLRVAIRRLLASLRLAGGVVGERAILKQRRMLRRTLRSFNDLRDVHISLLVLHDIARKIPAASFYRSSLRTRERTILREAASRLRGVKTAELRALIAHIQQELLDISADPLLRSATQAALLGEHAVAFARTVRARQAIRLDDPSSVHRLRIAFKRYRYTSEILHPYLPWWTDDRRKGMQAYQTAMGEVQDMEVLIAGVHGYAAERPMARRAALIPLQEELAVRRKAKIDAFVRMADAVGIFWGERL